MRRTRVYNLILLLIFFRYRYFSILLQLFISPRNTYLLV